ncbi:ribosome maturation factor RimM [Halobacteriovorax sp. GFR7]|uniref:ribosome maturation factor RimM n=1 Tax=unclassified Halobacteriovorax TaxID=2639665 RepID=UPI00372172D4
MKKNLENMVLLGTATRPHGIKGAFVFNLENKVNSVLGNGSTFMAMPLSGSKISKDGEEKEIKTISFGNKVIAYLSGVDNRNITEEMLPFEIYVSRDIFPDIEDEDEFYMSDIVGLDVYDLEKEDIVGKVVKYFDNGAHIVLVTKVNGKHVDIPFVDHFVKLVNLEENRVECYIPHLM